MRFIYSTDLHGNVSKYEAIKDYAIRNEIKLIHLGADLFPKGQNLHQIQKEFVKGYFSEFINKLAELEIQIICQLGNDDLHNSSKHLNRRENFHLLHDLKTSIPTKINEINFEGMPFVPDHPFSLKTTSRLDYKGWERPLRLSENRWEEADDLYKLMNPLAHAEDFENGEIENIYNIDQYLARYKTLEDELNNISTNDIITLHCPPNKSNLDMIITKLQVGSDATRRWIKRKNPLLVLCGHIHENYKMNSHWKCKVGKTLVIQPGQGVKETHLVDIEIDEDKNIHPKIYIIKDE